MSDDNDPGSFGSGAFGFGPEDFDRFAREASDGLREVFGKLFEGQAGAGAFSAMFDQGRTRTRPRPEPETTGEVGAGVWAVFVIDDDGGARVEQVHATELDALRANAANTDPRRRVRFLPYGIAVSALDGAPGAGEDPGEDKSVES